jgi:translation initiation factor 4G
VAVPSEEAPAQTEMNEEEAADTKITEYVKKFFDSRNLDEAESFFSTLPLQYHHALVNSLVASVVRPKEPDARLVADLFTRARIKGLCSPDALEDGLTPTVDMIKDIDISIDASKAWSLFATMASGAQLDQEHRTRLASKLLDGNEFLGFLSR